MPSVVALPRQVIGTALNLTGKAASAAATSGTVKNLVSSFADKVRSTRLAPNARWPCLFVITQWIAEVLIADRNVA